MEKDRPVVVEVQFNIRVPSQAVADMLMRWFMLIQLWRHYSCG